MPRVLYLDTHNLQYKYIEVEKAGRPDKIFNTQKKQNECLNIVPQITSAWSCHENNPRNFCKEFPEDVKLLVNSYLDQIGI